MLQPPPAPRRLGSAHSLLTAAACAGLLLQACADEAPPNEPLSPSDPLALIAPDASRPVAGPNGPYFASIATNGTGCPRGSWDAYVAPDGISYEVTFSKYEATLDDAQRVSFKDCNTTVKLHSPTPASFVVSAYQSRAYTFLEPGVNSFMTGNYFFQGNAVPSADRERRTDVTGPSDRHIVFVDAVREKDLVWSPCRLDNTLQIVHRLGVLKNQARGRGYINMSTLDGENYGRLWFQLRSRPCVMDASDAGDAGRALPAGAASLDAGLP